MAGKPFTLTIQQADQEQTSLASNSERESKFIIKELFAHMSIAYPKFCEEKDLVPTMRLWHQQLSEFPLKVIQAARDSMVDHHPTFAPRIGEFKALCRELMKSKPRITLALPKPDICSNCRSLLISDHHRRECVEKM